MSKFLRNKRDAEYIATLVDGMKQQDSNSFAAFFALTSQEEYRQMYAKMQDAYLAQDALQALYILFYRSLPEIETGMDAIDRLEKLFESITDSLMRHEQKKEGPKGAEFAKLTPELSEVLLYNILERLRLPNNTLPLDVIQEYDLYREKRFTSLRILILVLIVALISVPLLFINPEVSLLKSSILNPKNNMPVYQVSVRSISPIDSVVAKIDGKMMPVSQEDETTYTVKPMIDGEMTVTVKTLGKGKTSQTVVVDSADIEGPKMISSTYSNGKLLLYLQDEKSGIDFSGITAMTLDGDPVSMIAHNKKTGMIAFNYPDTSLTVSVPDKTGNILHLTLTK